MIVQNCNSKSTPETGCPREQALSRAGQFLIKYSYEIKNRLHYPIEDFALYSGLYTAQYTAVSVMRFLLVQ